MDYYSLLRPLLFLLPEERAHHLALWSLRCGLLPAAPPPHLPRLASRVCGLDFPHPLGLAAGFDKNAEAAGPLLKQGFSFVEAGTVTPRPQTGNPGPRLFRLEGDFAIINRMGFNNEGAEAFAENLNRWRQDHPPGFIGANIGKNKDAEDAIPDYVFMLERIYGLSDYITVNISSPNTPGLRQLQKKAALDGLLGAIMEKRDSLAESKGKTVPLLVKIAPDLSPGEREDIAEIALRHSIDGLIISNTTISRDGLKDARAVESGGLSGRPLFALSTGVLRAMYRLTGGKIPLIGAGGVFSGDDAYAKIRAGASLLQIYTSLVYEGFCVIPRILRRLDELMERDGFVALSDATGADER